MPRRDVFDRIAALLEERGMTEELSHLTALVEESETARAHAKTISEVTRALLASEKTYRLVFSHELDPMSLFDPKTGSFLDVNDAWVKAYGYTRDEALAMKVTDVSAEPAQTSTAIRELGPLRSTRIDVRWHRAKDGTVFPVELTAGSIELGGRPAMYAVMRDITQRHRAEHALARSEASFRALIESMPDAVFVHRHGFLVYMSPSARRMLGYAPEEDIRETMALAIVHPDDRELVITRVREMYTTGRMAPILEERLMRKDGTSLVAEIAAHHVVFDGEPAVLAIARDVSARKQIEAQLVMNDRLASLGRLSASIGHELNNPLAYVLGNITLVQRELAKTPGLPPPFVDKLGAHLAILEEGAKRMRDIVNDLKTLGRGEDDVRVAIDVLHILDVCCHMAEHELRTRGRLVKDYGPRMFVLGTEARLGQVFLNLLVNAAQALDPEHAATNEVHVKAFADGNQVVVEVSDTGVGIAETDMDRIFEPFFTTKDGSGMGLGLSISHQIVTAARGSIEASPREGGGTVFRVVLPSAAPR